MSVPAGFELQDPATVSPASQAVQPVYMRRVGIVWHLAVRVDRQHCNSAGFMHGGVIATLADNACWEAYYEAIDRRTSRIVTTSLSIDYLGSTSVGQWFEVAPRIIKAGPSSGLVDALMTADGIVVGRAHANFRVVERTPSS